MIGGITVANVRRGIVQAGTIGYSRGQIEIIDVEALGQTSCECHAAIRSWQAQLPGRRL